MSAVVKLGLESYARGGAPENAEVGDGSNTHASYKYLGARRIVTEDYEDIDVKLDYTANDLAALDRFGRVLDQVWSDYGASETLDEYTYTYDRAGSRLTRANELHSAFDEDYTYDALDRLTDSDRADAFDQSWTLDGSGNFSSFDDDGTSQTRTSNAANEISGITGGWITPAYDAAGNMISGAKPGDETTRIHYVYDAWNRLVAVYEDDGDGVYEPGTGDTSVASYKYDGANRRIEKVVTGTCDAHYYYNQQWQVLEERTAGGPSSATSDQYVWSPRYVDAPVVRFHDGNADGDCDPATDAADTIRYYAGDANYNVTTTITVGYTETVTEHYAYNAYGKATAYDEDWSDSLGAPTADGPLYCGYFFDRETRLYQVRNRYYNSSLSTFISRDPIGYKGDINLYAYCDDDPLMHIDPMGLQDLGGINSHCDFTETHPYKRAIGTEVGTVEWIKVFTIFGGIDLLPIMVWTSGTGSEQDASKPCRTRWRLTWTETIACTDCNGKVTTKTTEKSKTVTTYGHVVHTDLGWGCNAKAP